LSRFAAFALVFAFALHASACGGAGSAEGEPSAAAAALERAEIDAVVAATLHEVHLPGLAACVVRGGAVAWCKGYGLADVAARRPVPPDPPFLLASVSKVFTATALMQRWEQEGFDLDADVSLVTAFPIRYPGHAGAITYRRLLAHVAGIHDSDAMDLFY